MTWFDFTHVSGVFLARGKEDALVTLNSVPGVSVYGEKRISVDVSLTSCCSLEMIFLIFTLFRELKERK